MTIQMTALTHTANSISVNDIYSYHSPSQIDNRQIDSKQINNSQVDRCLANDINPTTHTATIHKTTTRAISEVIIPSFNDSNTVVSTIIASLTQQNSDRWTTWITSNVPNKTLLSNQLAPLAQLT